MGSVAWNPSNLGSTLKAWYKADAITGLSDGDAVASWSDSSGGGNTLTQSTAGAQPSYETNEVNSLPIVRFDKDASPGDNVFSADLGGNFEPGTGDFFIALVAKFPTATGTQFFMTKAASGTQGLNVYLYNGTIVFRPQTSGGTTNNIQQTSAADDAFHTIVCSRSSSVLGSEFDGSPFSTDNGSKVNDGDLNNDANFNIGSTSTGGLDVDMDLAEALVGVGTLSDADMERITGYFAHKYGLEGNLPSDHTYKSTAPTVTVLGLGGAGNTVLDIFVDTGATRKIGTIEGSFDSSVDTFTKYLDFLEPAEIDDVKLGLRTSKRFYGDLQLCEIKSIFSDTWVVTYNKTQIGGIHTSLERAVGEVAGTIANRGGWILNDIIPRDGYVDPGT